jgi:gliding motility-associated-like protein
VRSSTEVFAPCDGEIRLNAPSGGSGNNFTYRWSTGDTTRNLTNLCEDLYIVTITNEDGCTRIDSFDLGVLNANGMIDKPECGTGGVTGSIDVTVLDGQPPFTYLWNTGVLTEDLDSIDAGTYTVTITEASGASITRTFVVDSDSGLSVSMAFGADYRGFGVSCNGAEDGMLLANATAIDSMTTLEYAWVNADRDTVGREPTLVNIGAGIYQVLVSDGRCTETAQLAVTEPEAIQVVMVDVVSSSCSGDGNGEATVIVEGGAGDFSYAWSGLENNNFPTALGLAGGDYTVTITDRNDCSTTTEFTVTETMPLTLETSFVPITSASGGGTVAVAVTGGTPMDGYTYIWFDPNEDIIASGRDSIVDKLTLAGEYLVRVEDFNGCTAMATVELPNADGCLETRRVITPNGDGKNEAFIISCVESFARTRLEIYSRWGTAVFIQDNYDGQWMGTDGDGNRVPDGVYYYVLQYTDFAGEEQQQQGTITVLTE